MSSSQTKGTSIQYISLRSFNEYVFSYSTDLRRATGTLTNASIEAENAAERTILKYTGRRLIPGAYPGISTLMLHVRFIGSTSGAAYSGYIDPKIPSVFAAYNENAASNVDQGISTNAYTAGVNTTGNVMCSQLSTQGNAIIGGSLFSNGPAIFYDTTTIHGDVTAHSGVDIGEELNVSGNTTIEGTLDVSGHVGFDQTLFVSGSTSLASTLDVSGHVGFDQTLFVSGPTSLASTLDVSGHVGFDQTLFVSGSTLLASTLDVSGHVGFDQTLFVSGPTLLASTLDVSGHVEITNTTQSLNISTGSIVTAGGLGVAKNAYIGGDAQVLGTVYQDSYMLVPTGAIFPFAVGTAPAGYLLCDGTAVSRTTYSVLFGVIGTTYGVGNGTTTFNLPNFNGRIPIGYQSGTYDLAIAGGASSVTLTTLELPAHTHSGTTSSNGSHTHTYQDAYFAENFGGGANNVYGTSAGTDTDNSFYYRTAAGGYSTSPSNINTGSDGAHTHTFTTSSSGSGSAFSIMNPFLPVAYVIKY